MELWKWKWDFILIFEKYNENKNKKLNIILFSWENGGGNKTNKWMDLKKKTCYFLFVVVYQLLLLSSQIK